MIIRCGHCSSWCHRLAGRRGKKRAAAVVHSILVTIYSMLKNNTIYQDPSDCFHDLLNPEQILRWAIKRIERLGYKVSIETTAGVT